MSDARHAARLGLVGAATLALLRETADDHDQHDEVIVRAARDFHGQTTIDITYMTHGMPVGGEGL